MTKLSPSDVSFTLVLPAAGKGLRAKTVQPKQYTPIHGKALIRHTIERFHAMDECTRICVIIVPNDAELFHQTVHGLEKIEIVHGGEERKDSIFNALNHLSNLNSEDLVLVHDAARPCVRPDEIRSLLASLQEHRAATLAYPVTSTLRHSDQDGMAKDPVSRDGLWRIQTPQGFRYGDLIAAHKAADPDKSYTDDTQLATEHGIAVKLVHGSAENIKVTLPEDFKMAEKFLNSDTEIRCGQGFDVHAFDLEASGPVRLCGVDVAHDHALKGHSDADVGLHTLTDAIYGALGAGDIGIHFPPSDNTFKDMDSAVFLNHAMQMLRECGGALINADITLICEAPKIGPHASVMKERVAEICGVYPSRINVKATTTERLGFTGRKEGIAAQAVVSVRLPALEET